MLLPLDIDIDTSNIAQIVVKLVAEMIQLPEHRLVILVVEFLAWTDPMRLFLGTPLLAFAPHYYMSLSSLNKMFQEFCRTMGIQRASASLAKSKARTRGLLQEFKLSLSFGYKLQPTMPKETTNRVNSSWVNGACPASNRSWFDPFQP